VPRTVMVPKGTAKPFGENRMVVLPETATPSASVDGPIASGQGSRFVLSVETRS
jgi:hypothetical protein